MDKMKEYIRKMYGLDALSLSCVLVSIIINMAMLILIKTGHPGPTRWSPVSLIPLLVCLVRGLSTNRVRRSAENDWFVRRLDPLLAKKPEDDYGQKYRKEIYGAGTYHEEEPGKEVREEGYPEPGRERRYFKFFKCPACRQKIRVPRGKGRIEITCPRCGDKFIKKT